MSLFIIFLIFKGLLVKLDQVLGSMSPIVLLHTTAQPEASAI